jgi:hypothetical protein
VGDSWQGDPDRPLPPNSSWRPPLVAARRFGAAYERYETGRLTAPGKRAIAASCTPALARDLLARPPLVPPALGRPALAERVRAVDPLERLPGGVLVLLAVTRTVAGNTSSGAVELRLVQTHGRWLVDRVSVLS